MTGPKGNRGFCFPETLNVPRVEGKQNALFPVGPVIINKRFVIPPNSKIEQTIESIQLPRLQKIYFLDAGWHTNLPQFQGAQPDHV